MKGFAPTRNFRVSFAGVQSRLDSLGAHILASDVFIAREDQPVADAAFGPEKFFSGAGKLDFFAQVGDINA